MGICYYVIALDHKRAFDLDKGGWGSPLGELIDLASQANQAPSRAEFDAAIQRTWCNELSVEEYEKERAKWWAKSEEARVSGYNWFNPENFVFDELSGLYVSTRQYDEDAEKYTASPARALELARRDRAYALRVADRLWRFCEAHGPWSNLRVLNDSGDLPWWDDQWVDPHVWQKALQEAPLPPKAAGPPLDLSKIKLADFKDTPLYSTLTIPATPSVPVRERKWSGWLCVDSRFNAAEGAVEAAPVRLGDW